MDYVLWACTGSRREARHTRRFLVKSRRPKLDRCVGVGKPCRHHADHGVRLSIEQNALIHNQGTAAITPLPQPPAEKNCWIGRRAILIRREVAPQRELDAERRK